METRHIIKVLSLKKGKVVSNKTNLDYKMVLEVEFRNQYGVRELRMLKDNYNYGWISFERMIDYAKTHDFEYIKIMEGK